MTIFASNIRTAADRVNTGKNTMTKKADFDITKFCERENTSRPIFTGVCYRDGYMLASDSHMVAYVAAEYPAEYEGKTLNPYCGREIQGKYPDAESIIAAARAENTVTVKLDLARLKAACELCKAVAGSVTLSFTAEGGETIRAGMNPRLLPTIIYGLETFGIGEARLHARLPERRAILFEGTGVAFLLMPTMFGSFIDMDGTISLMAGRRDLIEYQITKAATVANQPPTTKAEVRKVRKAAKEAAMLRDLLAKADVGRWTDEEPAEVQTEAQTPEETEAPKDERPAVDVDGRRLYDFIAQGSKALDGKVILTGYYREDAMTYTAQGLATGLRTHCKKAGIRVFTPDGNGGHTLVKVQC